MDNKDNKWLQTEDGVEVYLQKWINESVPHVIVQIAHGMAEHIDRYDDFAKFLVRNGIFVYGNDHRGHGRTGEKTGLFGYFAEKHGFEKVTDDLYLVTQQIQKDFPQTPIVLLGHSMGSFLARRYIQKYPDTIDGLILSGTGGNPGFAGKIGKAWARFETRNNGSQSPSPTMDKLIFGSYNKGFEDVKSKFAWLSRDEKVVEEYLLDPYCGFICTSSFFYDLLTGLQIIHHEDELQRIEKNLPIFIFSGEKDPVGANTLGVKQVIHQYKKNGLHNIEWKFYNEGRHEMLNEINKLEVYHDILEWINHKILATA